jgi:hypothetical protein
MAHPPSIRPTCCKDAAGMVTWEEAHKACGPEVAGWCLCFPSETGNGESYVRIDYCPWCGKKLED